MKYKLGSAFIAVLLLALPPAVLADEPLPVEQLDRVLSLAGEHGIVAYREIESKDRGRVEVEGWLADGWYVEAEFDLANGELRKEEREQRSAGPGMTADDVRQAVAVAAAEGMTHFHEVEHSRTGVIEVEGRNADGQALEIRVSQADYRLLATERG